MVNFINVVACLGMEIVLFQEEKDVNSTEVSN